MDRAADAELLIAIAAAGSLSAAARRLERSQSTITRQLAAIERRLGVRLVDRTTRRLRLTTAGSEYVERARPAVTALREAERAATDAGSLARGILRVSAPPTWARARLGPVLAELAAGFPEVRVELELSDRRADLVAGGFDVAIRLGPLADSSLAGRALATERFVACAAPSYLARAGTPRVPLDLERHACVVTSTTGLRDRWPFRTGARATTVRVSGPLASDDLGMLRAAVLAGLGVGALPDYLVGTDLKAGTLVRVLSRAQLPAFQVHLLHPSRRHMARSVRIFIDLLARMNGIIATPSSRRVRVDD